MQDLINLLEDYATGEFSGLLKNAKFTILI